MSLKKEAGFPDPVCGRGGARTSAPGGQRCGAPAAERGAAAAAGDPETAQKLAQKALDDQEGDSGRALFILAEVATANRDMEGARTYFEKALQTAP